jgi:DNA-binding NarL/FixJ family response regulator
MTTRNPGCVVLADRHYGVAEGVRGLLETIFDVVVIVADEASLNESAARLHPSLAVVELTLSQGERLGWLSRLLEKCPELKVIVLSVHDEPSVRQATLAAGAAGYVVKRAISSDLLPAVDAVLAGGQYP